MSLPFFGHDRHDDALLPPALGADLDRGLPADPEVIARVRVQVTAELRRQAVLGSAGRATASAVSPVPARWRATLRPLASFGLAGALLLGSFGLVAANSGPGDPFYGLRLAAEELNLLGPATHLGRLQQRLDEASRESDNASAVTAALSAYRDELQRALAEATDDAGRRAIMDALDVHRVVLDALAQTVPDAAADGLEQARDQVGEAQHDLRGGGGPAPVTSPSPQSPSPERTARPGESRRPSNR